MYFLKGVAPMSGSEYSSSDSEATLDDIPPIVIDADLEEEENMSDMSSMLNLQGPDKLGNNQPLDIVPLNSIPFRQEVAFHQKVDSSKEEVPVPQWMKQLDNYKDGDWTVFLQIRDDGHKDWKIVKYWLPKILEKVNRAIWVETPSWVITCCGWKLKPVVLINVDAYIDKAHIYITPEHMSSCSLSLPSIIKSTKPCFCSREMGF
uniref:Uncharacterized protein n=1 Tax=Oryza glumipatula TaxID=40148 RepID=A0A0D9ZMV9_9ORYZ